MMVRRRTRKGTSLDADDRRYVLSQMKPEDEKAEAWLANSRFQVTQFGKVDRRCGAPVARDERPSTRRRQELGQIRALARAIVIEIKRTREMKT